jgi:bifunctional ADP-heptose synthase (sugar kinase/adenylyltransferase)
MKTPRDLLSFDAAQLSALTSRFQSLRVAVLGDFFLDKYLDTDPRMEEISVETGRAAHQVVAVRHSPGAAGTVMNNLSALGAGTLYAIGYTGDDGEGWELRRDLAAIRCDTTHLHTAPDRMTPVYLKPRYVTIQGLDGEHDRYDTKNRKPAPEKTVRAILASLDEIVPRVDAVVVMDQVSIEGSGAASAPVIEALAAFAKRFPKVVFWADSRGRIRRFRNVIAKVNEYETLDIEIPPPGMVVNDDDVAREQECLAELIGAPVFTTLGKRGVRLSGSGEIVPGVAINGPVDTTGAGDSFSAGATLALAAGASRSQAALVGNLVASVTVRQLATTGTASPADLVAALAKWRSQHL